MRMQVIEVGKANGKEAYVRAMKSVAADIPSALRLARISVHSAAIARARR